MKCWSVKALEKACMSALSSKLLRAAADIRRRMGLCEWMRRAASLPRRLRALAERMVRRHRIAFRKYQVAPRQGGRALQRRLRRRLAGREAPFSCELETATAG